MSYIGASPTTTAFVTDTFSGNGSTVAFTMSVAPASTTSILVSVTGVLQDPSTYSVSGTTLTFSAAPPSGTGNISVRYLGIPASGVTTTAYRTVTEFTATAGQTSFSVPSYTVGYIDVYRNGSRLNSADYTASTGTTVVLAAACNAGDSVTTESFYVSSVLNAIPATAGAVNSTYIAAGAVGSTQLGSGAVLRANMGANGTWAPVGTVLQVVQGSFSTSVSTSSSSYVDTGLSASITPTSASSKILARFSGNVVAGVSGPDASMSFNIVRNSTQITYNTHRTYDYGVSGVYAATNDSLEILDSPASTSLLTYKVQIKLNSGATAWLQNDAGYATITLMEIAA